MTIAKETRPLVTFEYMEYGVNAVASEAAGRPIPEVKVFAHIMQHGDKYSVTDKIAEDWIAQLTRMTIEGRYNPEWLAQIKLQYEEFLKGNELPREGTPIKTWPAPTREQIFRLLAIGITTVEDLAVIPDSGLGNIGLDGRNLRDLAKNYIESAKGPGVMAKKLSDLEQSDRDNKAIIARMSEQLEALKAAQPAAAKPTKGVKEI